MEYIIAPHSRELNTIPVIYFITIIYDCLLLIMATPEEMKIQYNGIFPTKHFKTRCREVNDINMHAASENALH